MRPRRRAFTLIELLVVVTLIGIVAATVTVRLAPATDRARLRAATLTIEQSLRLARHRAMTKHEPVWLELRRDGRFRLKSSVSAAAAWRLLDHISIEPARLEWQGRRGQSFAIRVTPGGATLPWDIQLRSGDARRVLSSDGVGGRLEHRDHVGPGDTGWVDTK